MALCYSFKHLMIKKIKKDADSVATELQGDSVPLIKKRKKRKMYPFKKEYITKSLNKKQKTI